MATKTGLAEGLGILTAFLLAMVPLSIWHAHVANILWGWFVTPITGILAPGIALLFGLTMFVRLFTTRVYPQSEGGAAPWEAAFKGMAFAFIYPALALLLGWLALQFV